MMGYDEMGREEKEGCDATKETEAEGQATASKLQGLKPGSSFSKRTMDACHRHLFRNRMRKEDVQVSDKPVGSSRYPSVQRPRRPTSQVFPASPPQEVGTGNSYTSARFGYPGPASPPPQTPFRGKPPAAPRTVQTQAVRSTTGRAGLYQGSASTAPVKRKPVGRQPEYGDGISVPQQGPSAEQSPARDLKPLRRQLFETPGVDAPAGTTRRGAAIILEGAGHEGARQQILSPTLPSFVRQPIAKHVKLERAQAPPLPPPQRQTWGHEDSAAAVPGEKSCLGGELARPTNDDMVAERSSVSQPVRESTASEGTPLASENVLGGHLESGAANMLARALKRNLTFKEGVPPASLQKVVAIKAPLAYTKVW